MTASTPDRIDINDEQALAEWADQLDTTTEQLKDAVAAVGERATDVEMHLKGTRSSTNADRVEDVSQDRGSRGADPA